MHRRIVSFDTFSRQKRFRRARCHLLIRARAQTKGGSPFQHPTPEHAQSDPSTNDLHIDPSDAYEPRSFMSSSTLNGILRRPFGGEMSG